MIEFLNGGVNMSAFIRVFSIILSFVVGFFSFPLSFLPSEISDDFLIETGNCTVDSIIFNGEPLNAETEGDVIFNDDGIVSFSENYKIKFNGDTLYEKNQKVKPSYSVADSCYRTFQLVCQGD